MQAIEELSFNPATQEVVSKSWWSGTATGQVTTNNGLVTVSSVEKSKLTGKVTDKYGTRPLSASGLGIVFIGGGATHKLNYACSESALTIKHVAGGQAIEILTVNFKREKNEP